MPNRSPPRTKRQIAEAITRAEAKTSGEIVVVVAIASDGYRSFGVLWAALLALAVPMPLIFATRWPVEYIYLLQLAGVLRLPRAVPVRSAALRAGAEIA